MATIEAVRSQIGHPSVLIHNAVRAPLERNESLSPDFFCQPEDIVKEVFHVA
ncbi:hypothetical protein [Pleurocapsa sp. PCC 7319]|uniref:hypothetical protein n=1 Tax=Pleurocapsa sp. PCC 7319 TaxID=118161 RepID=UPI00034CF731|nr:hypothetical protein [Pleurocapsa sp. PCC 7319]